MNIITFMGFIYLKDDLESNYTYIGYIAFTLVFKPVFLSSNYRSLKKKKLINKKAQFPFGLLRRV